MLNLPRINLPEVSFRRILPSYLAGGKECFLEVAARAGGAINPAWHTEQEHLYLMASGRDRRADKIVDDAEYAARNAENVRAVISARAALLYDTCVVSWSSNVMDDGKTIANTREKFIELCLAPVLEIALAVTDLQTAIIAAGQDAMAEVEASIKN